MASALGMRAGLTPALMEELGAGITDRTLPPILFQLGDAPDGSPRWGLAHLVRCRANGFMIVIPASEEMKTILKAMVEAPVEALFYVGTVQVLNVRGRVLGDGAAELVDLPWEAATQFIKQSSLRGQLQRQSAVVGLEIAGERCRPQPTSVQQLAEEWIVHVMDEDCAQEYITAAEEELQPVGDEPPPLVEPGREEEELAEDPQSLRERIKELEAQVLASKTGIKAPVAAAPPPPSMYGKTAGLFQAPRGQAVTAEDMQHLQVLAGTPPPRLGQHETRRQLTPLGEVPLQDGLMAEMDKEVLDHELGSWALGSGAKEASSLSQLLVTQVQQNSLLLQKVLQQSKPSDPILGALTGSDSGSANSSAGVKGCVAREAFCRTAKDLEMVSTVVRRNALAELGMDVAREDESVMRRYIERRIPLADHRLLCHVATLAAEGWAVAFQSKNQQMLGFLSILLMFVEQVALDQGKLQLGWLLTGLAEPNHQVHFGHAKRPGLKPFSRLASPLWVSANLAYLRDLDYLESRMDQVGNKKKTTSAAAEEDAEKSGKPAPKRKNRKGKGKGNDAEEGTKEAAK
eukprot:Skav222714  [mRNA]  locus=scaffold1661:316303:318021:- [translate_table: standard]